MSMETDILDMIISSHGISTADLKEAFDGEYTPKQIANTLTRLKSRDQVELIDGLNFATSAALNNAPSATAQPAPADATAPICEDAGDETEHVGAGPVDQIEAVPTTAKLAASVGVKSEALARQIRAGLGPHNHADEPVIKCVMNLVDDYANATCRETGAFRLLADIRAAAGDPEGRLMQDELIKHIEQLHRDAEEARAVRRYFAGFGKEQPLQNLVQRLNGDSLMLGKICALVEEYCPEGATTYEAVAHIVQEFNKLNEQEGELLNIINHTYTAKVTRWDLVETVTRMVQHLDEQPGPQLQPAANQDDSQPKITIATAIEELQAAAGECYDDDAHMRVYPDRVLIAAMGHLFELPNGNNDEITQFLQSVSWISGQVLVDKAA